MGKIITKLTIAAVSIFTLSLVIYTNILPASSANTARIYEQREFTVIARGNADELAKQQLRRSWSKYQPTGIYADPNEKLIIELSGDNKITAYIHNYESLGVKFEDYSWNEKSFDIIKGKNIISAPTGGVLYLSNENYTGNVTVSVTGGSFFAVFEKGVHTEKDWHAMLKKYEDSPVVELVSELSFITASFDRAKKFGKNLEETLNEIDQFIDAQNNFSGYDKKENAGPHQQDLHYKHFVENNHNTEKYAYAPNYRTEYVNDAIEKVFDVDWIALHEVGHKNQQTSWMFKNMLEVQVNLYSLISEKELGRISTLENNYEEGYGAIFEFLNQNSPTYDKIPNPDYSLVKLGMLWQLHLSLGDDFYPNLHREYREIPADKQPKNEEEKKQLFMILASRVANRNLLPFFDKWRLEPSNETRNEIERLELTPLQNPIWESTDTNPILEYSGSDNYTNLKEIKTINSDSLDNSNISIGDIVNIPPGNSTNTTNDNQLKTTNLDSDPNLETTSTRTITPKTHDPIRDVYLMTISILSAIFLTILQLLEKKKKC